MKKLIVWCLTGSLLNPVLLALISCSTAVQLSVGLSEAELLRAMGQPDAQYVLPTGERRWSYIEGPWEQLTWMVDLSPDDRVLKVRQVRTLPNFFQIKPGVDTPTTVEQEFGKPWRIEHYSLSGLTGYLYPYLEDGFFKSMMTVYFDSLGVVQRVENGPDPRFLGGDRDF